MFIFEGHVRAYKRVKPSFNLLLGPDAEKKGAKCGDLYAEFGKTMFFLVHLWYHFL